MQGPDALVATAAYQPEPTAAAAARRFVRDTLQTWLITGAAVAGHGLVDDAVLLTSELVTNAVVHAGTPVEVTCKLADGGVEVVVSDGHPASLVPEPPENEHIPAERTSGRGLLLPAALASAWGVTYGRSAKAVWFRIGQAESALEPGRRAAAPPPDTGFQRGSRSLGRMDRQSWWPHCGQAPVAPVVAGAAGAPGRNGIHRWPVPPFGEPGYDELLTTTVESARAAVGADAAYAMVPDEDGELRLRAAVGRFPLPAVTTAPAAPVLACPGSRVTGEGGSGRTGVSDPAGHTQAVGKARTGRASRGQDAPGRGKAGQDGGAGQAGRSAGRSPERPAHRRWQWRGRRPTQLHPC